ncbi:hypothetical protein BLOT_009384 [Blomia tropicalis]|nr:hypothetical protein BLOT_009384 [Blomia tropicalis]
MIFVDLNNSSTFKYEMYILVTPPKNDISISICRQSILVLYVANQLNSMTMKDRNGIAGFPVWEIILPIEKSLISSIFIYVCLESFPFNCTAVKHHIWVQYKSIIRVIYLLEKN